MGEGDKFINCQGEDGKKHTRLLDNNTEKSEYENQYVLLMVEEVAITIN